MPKRDDEFTVDGEPSKKVYVHNVHQGKEYGLVEVFENAEELLAKHKQNLGKSEHVLERKMEKPARWVPIEEYKKELRASKGTRR